MAAGGDYIVDPNASGGNTTGAYKRERQHYHTMNFAGTALYNIHVCI